MIRSKTLRTAFVWGVADAILFIALVLYGIENGSIFNVLVLLITTTPVIAGYMLADLDRVIKALQISRMIAFAISFSVLSQLSHPFSVAIGELAQVGLAGGPRPKNGLPELGFLVFYPFSVLTFSIMVGIFGGIAGYFAGTRVQDWRNAKKLRPLDPLSSPRQERHLENVGE